MKIKTLITHLLIPFILITMGCSGVNPVTNENSSSASPEINGIAVSQTGPDTYRGIVGAFQVYINPHELTGEIIPFRNAGKIGDVFDSHITEFLLFNPCRGCLRIGGLGLIDDATVAVDLMIRHPFTNLEMRPDLHVFDVRGIVLTPGAVTFSQIISDVNGDGNANEMIQTNPNFVINADGYTTHFDDSTLGDYFDPPLNYPGNLNPFKSFFIDTRAQAFDPFQPEGHNVMPVNSAWDTQTYQINNPDGGDIVFTFIVDASYGHSAKRWTRDNPQYYLPEYNRKEAREVHVELYNDNLEEGQLNSEAYIQVLVKDWQAQKARDENYPNPSNPGGLSEVSDVDQVEVSCPDFGFFEVKSRLQSEAGGAGSETAPYDFHFGPLVCQSLTSGIYYGIIAVRDDLAGQAGPLPITTPPGATFPHTGPDIRDYTAYQIIKIEVREAGTLGCPSSLVPFGGYGYTQAIGAVQNANDTVVGVGTSPANMLDIDYGIHYPRMDIFALEQGGILGAGIDSGAGGFWVFIPGQPGCRVGSIDVDSENRLIFSGNNLGYSPGPVTVTDRNNNATDKFSVWLLTTFPATPVVQIDIDPVSDDLKVIAIETDWNDNVWMIDSDNYMHKYLVEENYKEDTVAGFDLNDAFPALPNPAAFQGEVFDFAIDFHNKALFILTDYGSKGTLYRIECDGTYYPTYGEINPNPVQSVLFGPHNGLADIYIDNYDEYTDVLLGDQDSQILITGGRYDGVGNDWMSCLFITRINSNLSNPRYAIRDYGSQCMAVDPVNNLVRIVHGGPDGNEYFSLHQPQLGWK